MSVIYYLKFIYIINIATFSVATINVQVKEAEPNGMTVNVSWIFSRQFPSIEISWDAINYISEPTIQVVSKFAGHLALKNRTLQEHSISENLKLDQQYMICVLGEDPNCTYQEKECAYLRVSRYSKVQKGSHLYLVMSAVSSKTITVTWSVVPRGHHDQSGPRTDIGYKLEYRRVDGRIEGHPGHSSNIVSNTQMIKGLQAATRYEICVGETLNGREGQTCDQITTLEDLPGPPVADQSSCQNQARGTHWRCDVFWMSPKTPNGKIKGYVVAWRDQEGYDLHESTPRGVLCDPFCMDSQVLHFHPYQVCVRALTSKGYGWESCVKVSDMSGRIIELFEPQFLIIILGSILAYTFGLRILKAVFRCCVSFLYKRLEQEKKHPV